jgi:hypothetical protein
LTENQFSDGNSNPASKCNVVNSANIILNRIYTFRKLEIPLVKIPNSPLCPYQAYTNMCKLVPADNDNPAF